MDHGDCLTFQRNAVGIILRKRMGMGHSGGRTNGTQSTVERGNASILPQIGKPRQGKGRQDAQNHDDHDQFDQGETTLLLFHSAVSWLDQLKVLVTSPVLAL